MKLLFLSNSTHLLLSPSFLLSLSLSLSLPLPLTFSLPHFPLPAACAVCLIASIVLTAALPSRQKAEANKQVNPGDIMRKLPYIRIHSYIHTYIRMYVCMYIHTYTHTFINTYILLSRQEKLNKSDKIEKR